MDPEQLVKESKVLVHLLGESFPNKFVIALVFERDDRGGLSDNMTVVANVQNDAEASVSANIVRRIVS